MSKSKDGASLAVVHASEREVNDSMFADVVDAILGAGGAASLPPASAGEVSLYKQLFGDAYIGRPRRGEDPPEVGYPTGNTRVTATARRRAARVLQQVQREAFEAIMAYEVHYLLQHPEEVPAREPA